MSQSKIDKKSVFARMDGDKEVRERHAMAGVVRQITLTCLSNCVQLWTRRPVAPDLLAYCIQDVCHLFKLCDVLTANLSSGMMDRIRSASTSRVDECKLPTPAPEGKERAKAPPL